MMDWRNSKIPIKTVIIFLLMILVVPVAALDVMQAYPSLNLPGGDYKTIIAYTGDDCSNACLNDAQCRAATWSQLGSQNPFCVLKNAVPAFGPPDPYGITISYVKETVMLPTMTYTVLTTTTPSCHPFTLLLFANNCTLPNPQTKTCVVSFIYTTVGAYSPAPGEITSIAWDFGDGSQETESFSPTINKFHQYKASGNFPVKITATRACGMDVTASRVISVKMGGILNITASPPGGMLYIDNTPVDRLPLKQPPAVDAGSHRILIVTAGYNDYSTDVTVAPGDIIPLNIVLQPSSPPAAAAAIPPAAPGSPMVTGTPALIVPAAGTYAQVYPASTMPQPAAGTVSPNPLPAGTGTVIVSSNPAGANIYIDGQARGKTPATLPDIPAGPHNLLLVLQGYPEAARTFNVSAGSENQISVDLTGKKTPGFDAIAAGIAFLAIFLGRRTGWP